MIVFFRKICASLICHGPIDLLCIKALFLQLFCSASEAEITEPSDLLNSVYLSKVVF